MPLETRVSWITKDSNCRSCLGLNVAKRIDGPTTTETSHYLDMIYLNKSIYTAEYLICYLDHFHATYSPTHQFELRKQGFFTLHVNWHLSCLYTWILKVSRIGPFVNMNHLSAFSKVLCLANVCVEVHGFCFRCCSFLLHVLHELHLDERGPVWNSRTQISTNIFLPVLLKKFYLLTITVTITGIVIYYFCAIHYSRLLLSFRPYVFCSFQILSIALTLQRVPNKAAGNQFNSSSPSHAFRSAKGGWYFEPFPVLICTAFILFLLLLHWVLQAVHWKM